MIKDHPYADGCKRIAVSLFLEVLDKIMLYSRIMVNALVTVHWLPSH